MMRKIYAKFLCAALLASTIFGVAGCAMLGISGGNSEQIQSSGQVEEVITERVVLKTKQYMFFLADTEDAQKISANVYDNGTALESAEVTYQSSNPNVAEVLADGTIVKKSAGLTKITVSYKRASATAEVRVIGKATAEEVNTFDEAYINTYGRVYKQNGKLCLDYVASGVDVAIDGESLTAEIESTATLYLCVYVDDAKEYERIEITPGKKTYTLASGLESGFHTIRLAKSSEVYDGQIRLVSLSSEGFYTAPEKSTFRIEFIGDSITAGYGALGEAGASRTVQNSDACSSYAYYTAQALDADYSVVAIQGICVKENMWIQDCMSDVYPLVSPLNPVAYDFAEEADVVVLNLGTNDAGYITSKDFDYSEQFPNDYLQLLQFIREKNPNAYIICLYGFMGKQSSVESGIKKAVESLDDEKTIYLNSGFIQNGYGANGHPAQSAQKVWGEILAEYIQSNIMER